MNFSDLTLVIPAKEETNCLFKVLEELQGFDIQKIIIIPNDHNFAHDSKFEKIKVLDFSYFPQFKENISKINDIEIIYSQNDPFKNNEKKRDKLIVAQFAWDSNAYPGNELWIGHFTASGDPAAACCSGITAMYEKLDNGEDQYVQIYK